MTSDLRIPISNGLLRLVNALDGKPRAHYRKPAERRLWIRGLTNGLLFTVLTFCGARSLTAAMVKLMEAVVVAPATLNAVEQQAVTMLIDEVAKRTQVRWERTMLWPDTPRTVILVGSMAALHGAGSNAKAVLPATAGEGPAEGFSVRVLPGD